MSIYKRANGRYAVQVDFGFNPAVKRLRKTIGSYGTKREAEAAEREALTARDRGTDMSPTTSTVEDLMQRYLADCEHRCAPKTIERYREIAAQYVLPYLSAVRIAKLRPAGVSAWISELHKRPKKRGSGAIAPKTVAHAFSVLRAAFSWGVSMQIATSNPTLHVRPPRVPRSQITAFSAEDVDRILTAAEGTRWETMISFALATGIRRGELAALRWANVDLRVAKVTIRESLTQTNAGIARKTTKSERVRVLPLSPLAIAALRRQSAMQAADKLAIGPDYQDDGFVFAGPLGGFLKPHGITMYFHKVAIRAGVPATALHALRHTAATWMLAGGTDLRSAAGVLGHSNATTTLSTYAHAIDAAESSAVASIETHLTNARAVRAADKKARDAS